MNTSETLTPDTVVSFLADIFASRGDSEYLGEPVTVSQHMLQGRAFRRAEWRGGLY